MQYSLDAVDWDWLLSQPTPRARVDAMLDGTGHEGGYVSYVGVESDWIDSGTIHFDVWGVIESRIWDADKPTADLLDTAWRPILEGGDKFDDLGLSAESSGCFYASLAPARVRKMADAMELCDLDQIADGITNEHEERHWVIEFLRQRSALVRHARDRGYGVVAHAG
jgi:hypothetical protein